MEKPTDSGSGSGTGSIPYPTGKFTCAGRREIYQSRDDICAECGSRQRYYSMRSTGSPEDGRFGNPPEYSWDESAGGVGIYLSGKDICAECGSRRRRGSPVEGDGRSEKTPEIPGFVSTVGCVSDGDDDCMEAVAGPAVLKRTEYSDGQMHVDTTVYDDGFALQRVSRNGVLTINLVPSESLENGGFYNGAGGEPEQD